jgi:hypothetical protein
MTKEEIYDIRWLIAKAEGEMLDIEQQESAEVRASDLAIILDGFCLALSSLLTEIERKKLLSK